MTTAAAAIIAELRARGVELVPAGERIRYRPGSAVPPELVERLRAHKADVLAILTAARRPGVMAYRHPWPDTLAGHGPHHVGPFELCGHMVAGVRCAAWTWTRYGDTPTCSACARALWAPHGRQERR